MLQSRRVSQLRNSNFSWLTRSGAAHINPAIRRAVRYRRDDAPAKLLTSGVTRHPALSEVLGFGGFPALREGGPPWSPGCLTSESEERETWTAESLRTASSNGEGASFFPEEDGHGRDFGGQRLRYIADLLSAWAQACEGSGSGWTSSKRVICQNQFSPT